MLALATWIPSLTEASSPEKSYLATPFASALRLALTFHTSWSVKATPYASWRAGSLPEMDSLLVIAPERT